MLPFVSSDVFCSGFWRDQDLIRKIVSQANLDNPVDLRNVTMYVLCFTGFFRFDDISRVRRGDMSFHEGFMVIQVQKSKNDQLRRGNKVVISKLSSSACPVSLLKRYLDKFPQFTGSPF